MCSSSRSIGGRDRGPIRFCPRLRPRGDRSHRRWTVAQRLNRVENHDPGRRRLDDVQGAPGTSRHPGSTSATNPTSTAVRSRSTSCRSYQIVRTSSATTTSSSRVTGTPYLTTSAGSATAPAGVVRVSGPPTPSTSTRWTTGSEGGSSATQSEIQDVLDDVSNLRIRGEYHSGPDKGYLDNVELDPS